MSSNWNTFFSPENCIDSTVVLYLSSELDQFLARIWVGFTIFEIVKSEDHLIIHFTNYSWQPSLNWEISFEQLAPCLDSFFTNLFFFWFWTLGDTESSRLIQSKKGAQIIFLNFVFGFLCNLNALGLPWWKISTWKYDLKMSRLHEKKIFMFIKKGCLYKTINIKRYGFYLCEK